METIKSYLETMFANMPNTPEVLRAKQELWGMMVQTEGKSVGETVAIYKHKRKLNNIAPARVNNKFNNFNQRPKHSDEFYNSVLDN